MDQAASVLSTPLVQTLRQEGIEREDFVFAVLLQLAGGQSGAVDDEFRFIFL